MPILKFNNIETLEEATSITQKYISEGKFIIDLNYLDKDKYNKNETDLKRKIFLNITAIKESFKSINYVSFY